MMERPSGGLGGLESKTLDQMVVVWKDYRKLSGRLGLHGWQYLQDVAAMLYSQAL